MSTLLRMLEEANVPLSVFCEKLDLSEDQALEIANTADEDAQMDAYLYFVTAMNDESLFPELMEFYAPFVSDKEELAAFITSALRLRSNNIPRRMLNSVHRLVTLADAMDEVRPGKDSLKIFYFVVCIETLYSLAGAEMLKYKIVIDFFNQFIEADDKRLILERFRRSLGDERYRFKQLSHETETEYKARINNSDRLSTQITMEIFARIINEIRNCFAHEGNYWNFSFANSDYSMMNSVTVAENHVEFNRKRDRGNEGQRRVYEVDLTYDQFKSACIRAFLQFIRAYTKEINA
ncbi:hypothetical protein B1748_19915 [Paenibacillus sp. MY03]|uniref:hypothetical protein n=1 Tax=Paenibacillus sp. MY03 TaxID=302980 RepID=UPI000B3D2A21|nr:hypothetical protein [Paenibacillus sp. MY03]OUS74851.1 hypothetical protein B1748_19915 [Paenibacillus sp. MY03]